LLAGYTRDWCSSSHDADFMLSSMDSLSPSDKVWIYKLLFKHISYFYVCFWRCILIVVFCNICRRMSTQLGTAVWMKLCFSLSVKRCVVILFVLFPYCCESGICFNLLSYSFLLSFLFVMCVSGYQICQEGFYGFSQWF
jgi:hypothetical protein